MRESIVMDMAFHSYLSFLLIIVLTLAISPTVAIIEAVSPILVDVASLNGSSFPAGFTFGTASSAYQHEGAANAGGRGPRTWDTITHKHAEGKTSVGINQEGIKYYNNLIDELLVNGLRPSVTLHHWDLPQVLENEYKGFFSAHIIKDFEDYAELCFKEFGDRVKHWILNEPWTNSLSTDQPYIVEHHQLLAHAASVKIYRTRYQVL